MSVDNGSEKNEDRGSENGSTPGTDGPSAE